VTDEREGLILWAVGALAAGVVIGLACLYGAALRARDKINRRRVNMPEPQTTADAYGPN